MKKGFFYSFSFLLVGLTIMTSCSQKEKSKETSKVEEKQAIEIKIEAENLTDSNEQYGVKVLASGEKIVQATSEGWIVISVNVIVAGRYKSELQVASPNGELVTCWIEDYVYNTDKRTYNVSGNMMVSSTDLVSKSVDGTPLNIGEHKMKVHFNRAINIDLVKFTLIKKHDITPKTLTQRTDGKEWKVVWSDEFEGTEVDTTKWTYDIGNWGWGNYELQYYTKKRIENARIEEGNLIIEARKDDLGAAWTSARLTTRGKTSFLYGRIEFRAKVPVEKGNWAAGWTLGDEYVDELSWPYCGEIDILESVGFEIDDETGKGIAHASAHTKAYYFKIGNQKTFTVEVENMNTEFHTYAIEWTPEGIIGFVDEVEYFYYKEFGAEDVWPFNKPQNIILNLAMGGGWGGFHGMDENVTSQKMIIDYVRVSELQ